MTTTRFARLWAAGHHHPGDAADGAKADIYLETTDGFFDIYEYA